MAAETNVKLNSIKKYRKRQGRDIGLKSRLGLILYKQ